MMTPTNMPIRFETERFLMRPLTRDDVSGRVVRWLHDDELLRYVELPVYPSVEDFKRFLRQFDNVAASLLGIFDKSDDKMIGFYQVQCDFALRRASTEVLIGDRRFWGTDAVSQTRSGLLDYLFDELDMHRVYGTVHARNLPAVFNYKALGFTCEGILRDHARSSDQKYSDVYFFGLLKSEWQERRAGAASAASARE